jgi:hypothetical protein
MSRQPTWDMACAIQADMFREAASAGGLDIQLIYYRGFGECRTTPWLSDTKTLGRLMGQVDCRSGHTQIHKILSHALRENSAQKLGAVLFVGDAMEEAADDLRLRAGELGMYGVPVFVFQEGDDPDAANVFRDIARLSKGAYCRFSAGSAQELAELLRAVAAYASGGLQALQLAKASGGAAKLLAQLR